MAKNKKIKANKIAQRKPAKTPPQKAKKPVIKKEVERKQVKVIVKNAAGAKAVKPAAPSSSETAVDKKELGFYRDKLAALRSEILNQIKEISEDTLMQSQKDVTGEASGYTMHMADVASDNYEREFNFRVVSGDRELLLEIESAIKKIENGDYGICVMCDKTIGKSRLNVIPYAKYCRKCKEQLEKDGKL
jgi:RNA polymerase-binding protein DksA